jgi:hypothetical protein
MNLTTHIDQYYDYYDIYCVYFLLLMASDVVYISYSLDWSQNGQR